MCTTGILSPSSAACPSTNLVWPSARCWTPDPSASASCPPRKEPDDNRHQCSAARRGPGRRCPPDLILRDHGLCPGCGEPVALRLLLEVLQELEIVNRTIGVVGHGCYGSFVQIMDVDVLQCLHGRAPSCATGIKRVRPSAVVFTLQGDGDMVNEGLQEVLHTAARGENVTWVLLNNGVFGDTGGQQTSTTVIGQRTKTSLAGGDPATHGSPPPAA